VNIKQLIEHLGKYPEDAVILVWDPELEDYADITGSIYDPTTQTVELCSDDNE
jgi:hypothetical protein